VHQHFAEQITGNVQRGAIVERSRDLHDACSIGTDVYRPAAYAWDRPSARTGLR